MSDMVTKKIFKIKHELHKASGSEPPLQ